MAETVKLVVTDPKGAFARLGVDGDYAGPFLFALMLGWVMAIIAQLWGWVFGPIYNFGSSDFLQQMESMGLSAAPTAISVVIMAVLYPFIFVFFLFVGCGINHLCLFLVGALEHSESGFEGTFKTACYAQVSALCNLVPIVGGILSMVAALVLLVIGFSEVHRTTTIRSALAVLIPVFLCCACGIVAAFLVTAAVASSRAGSLF